MSNPACDALAFGVLIMALSQMVRAGISLWYAWQEWEESK